MPPLFSAHFSAYIMNIKHLIILLILLLANNVSAAVVDSYQAVDLDRFIAEQQPLQDGKRFIVKPHGVLIQAELMSMPEKKSIKYAYTALMMMNINPLPSIDHRMFIRSAAGKVIAVYVEEQGLQNINEQLKPGDTVSFSGYHIYNYRLGPAIVIEGFTQL